MSLALYRKYRSQDFEELVGQDHITKALKNAVKKSAISHAYLFVGSRGTGKTSTARILSKALNCLKPLKNGNPCNECEVCTSINQGKYMDLIEIDAASNRGIDQIRELKEKLEFNPAEGKYKIYIIDEVHMLTTEAFNALLKTLEEPPEHIIFMLATTEVHKLPATILSRCQRYDFKLGTDKEVKKILKDVSKGEGIKINDDALKLIVKNAQGSYRDALSFFDIVLSGQIDGRSPKEIDESEVRAVLGLPENVAAIEFLSALVESESKKAFKILAELDSQGTNFQYFVKEILETLRQELVARVGEKKEKINWLDLRKDQLLKLIKLFIEADQSLYNAAVPVLPLELVVAECEGLFLPLGEAQKAKGNKAEHLEENEEEEDTSQDTDEDLDSDSEDCHEMETVEQDNVSGNEKIDKLDEISSDADKSSCDFDTKTVKDKWGDLKGWIKKKNGHLFAMLEGSKLKGVEEGIVKIRVTYSFHKEALESVKSRTIIMEAFENVMGKAIKYECTVEAPKVSGAIKSSPMDLGITSQQLAASNKKKDEKTNAAKHKTENAIDQKSENPKLNASKIEKIFAGL